MPGVGHEPTPGIILSGADAKRGTGRYHRHALAGARAASEATGEFQ